MTLLARAAAGALVVASTGLGCGGTGTGEPAGAVRDPTSLEPADAVHGPALAVEGNPGWDGLSDADRARAARPLDPAARAWLVENAGIVRRTARQFGVSPVALGGIVAVEKTLLTGRVDVVGEELFGAVLGSLRTRDLERWVADQEARYRAGDVGARQGRPLVRDPYLWTLGPAQVSFRLAVRYEPVVARLVGRPERDVKQVLAAVRSVPGNLEYAAALLADAQVAYRKMAGMDLTGNPGVLATLYHLGAPETRARRLADANAARALRGQPPEPPHVNYYGAFVNLHAAEIATLLGLGP